ncbi:integrase catalytic domain-containing protein [Trichonephila inaurata madagascariensis]|uniref:Integrase catalytic domain-containing protein n=1 Tax=Trichonephila inaurata madagascariensis TaxID=2747483 RepID=A0A8X6X0Y1_9ARAC|nr:integrase catalytic domain-containing protein [Trichonephila inaurata madagascariensis]
MTQTFWSRWTSDYLNHLQSRPKWYKDNQKFKVNEVVLVKGEDNSKLLNWNLAKIIQVHPGTDDVTRVVTLKTGKGVHKRPVTKILKLPFKAGGMLCAWPFVCFFIASQMQRRVGHQRRGVPTGRDRECNQMAMSLRNKQRENYSPHTVFFIEYEFFT